MNQHEDWIKLIDWCLERSLHPTDIYEAVGILNAHREAAKSEKHTDCDFDNRI